MAAGTAGRRPASNSVVRQVEQILSAVRRWAVSRADILAVGLVGSWARNDATADSDVDLVVLTTRVDDYVEGTSWIDGLPRAKVVKTRAWGDLVERRLALPSGLEIEVGVATPTWTSTDPVDPGTARVVAGGLRILHDPQSLLAALLAEVDRAPEGRSG